MFPRAAFGVAFAVLPTVASAQPEIGQATAVTASASAELGPQTRSLNAGVGVVQDETVRTNPSGTATFRFVDDTVMTVGPGSAVKLDRFVYAPGSPTAKFVINATKGVFRFSTGHLPKPAYEIRTPFAVLGVRGTVFTFTVEPTRVVVSVSDGSVTSCPPSGATTRCTQAREGQSLVAVRTGITMRPTPSLPPALQAPLRALPALPAATGPALRDAVPGAPRGIVPTQPLGSPLRLPDAIPRLGVDPGIGAPLRGRP